MLKRRRPFQGTTVCAQQHPYADACASSRSPGAIAVKWCRSYTLLLWFGETQPIDRSHYSCAGLVSMRLSPVRGYMEIVTCSQCMIGE